MLRLPEINIHLPNTLMEAHNLLSELETTVVAGGTDLYPNLKRRQVKYSNLVSLSRISSLRGICGDAAIGLIIGALTTLTEIANDQIIKTDYPALAEAASLVSTPQLRNVGTLGGNICLDTRCMFYNQNESWRNSLGYCLKSSGQICQAAPKSPRCFAVSSADTVPVLVALGAWLVLSSQAGGRVIPIEDLYGRDGINYLTKRPGEIITDIVIPPAEGLKMIYLKIRKRNSIDFPVASIAAVIEKGADNKVKRARIVLGALESRPLLLEEAAALVVGNELTSEVIEAAAEIAYVQAKPVDNTDMGAAYRKQMARVLTRRAFQKLSSLNE